VDSADEKSIYEMYEEGSYTVQLAAELLMTREDFARVYGSPYSVDDARNGGYTGGCI
jgi:hypothetical protein